MDSNFCEFKSGYFLQQLASQTLVMVCFNCLFCVKKTFSASIVEQRKWKRKRYPFTASSFRFRFHKNLPLPPLPLPASVSASTSLCKTGATRSTIIQKHYIHQDLRVYFYQLTVITEFTHNNSTRKSKHITDHFNLELARKHFRISFFWTGFRLDFAQWSTI